MRKPEYTECPICGNTCTVSEPHEEVYTKRKQWCFIHLHCLGRRENERVNKEN